MQHLNVVSSLSRSKSFRNGISATRSLYALRTQQRPLYGCQYYLPEKTNHKRYKVVGSKPPTLCSCKVVCLFLSLPSQTWSLVLSKGPSPHLLTFLSLVKMRFTPHLFIVHWPLPDMLLDFALNCRCQAFQATLLPFKGLLVDWRLRRTQQSELFSRFKKKLTPAVRTVSKKLHLKVLYNCAIVHTQLSNEMPNHPPLQCNAMHCWRCQVIEKGSKRPIHWSAFAKDTTSNDRLEEETSLLSWRFG